MIPKIIHQIWLPNKQQDEMPQEYKNYCAGWAIKNPSFKYIMWNENVFNEFGGKSFVYDKYRLKDIHPAQVSDIIRMLLLQKFGGVYIDIDVECHQCIEPLMVNDFITYSYGYECQRMILAFDWWGAIPNHRMVNHILDLVDEYIDKPIDVLWKYSFRRWQNEVILGLDKDITIFGVNTIRSYLTHHFFNSWCKPDTTGQEKEIL